jgi:CRP-like cAMP-binding protein
MNTFLNKISQLNSIHEVIFLSHFGEVLFYKKKQDGSQPTDAVIALWNDCIASLGKPQTMQLLFRKARYYLGCTDIGYVIVGMGAEASLANIKKVCANAREKLGDPVVCKKVLLKMLSDADERLKPQLINSLHPFADAEIAQSLMLLLEKEEQFDPQEKDRLLLSICRILGHCSSQDALVSLYKIISSTRADKRDVNSSVEQAARISIRQLELDRSAPAKPASPIIVGDSGSLNKGVRSPAGVREASGSLEILPEEYRIKESLANNKYDEAVDLLMQLIETAAGQNNFPVAERLRNWLIEIDPMSLMKIIHAAEIIEEAKTASINSEHLIVWQDLLQALSPEEFSSLYHALTPQKFPNRQMVVSQGDFFSFLLFVNSGRVQLYAVSQDREVSLKIVGPGEIMGAENFFEGSVWTVNARSLGAEISLLKRNKLQALQDSHPALQAKLLDFCKRGQTTNTLFSRTKGNRRQFERKKITGRAIIVLLDGEGKETAIGARGDLIDISRGGLAFGLRFSKKENAMALLGKKIKVAIRSDLSPTSLLRKGLVMAIRCHDFVGNDYSVHVQFSTTLSVAELQQVGGKDR